MKETFSIFGGRLHMLRQDFMPSEDGLWLTSAVSGIFPKEIKSASVLDAFSGTGIVGLSALHFGAKNITAVDTDANLVGQSMANANLNNWAEKWTPICADISDLKILNKAKYNLVLANPPFHAISAGFSSELELKRSAHALEEGNLTCWLPSLWSCVNTDFKNNGLLAIILHVREVKVVQTFLNEYKLNAQWIFLETSPKKSAKRIIVIISQGVEASEGVLCTWDEELRVRVLRQGQAILTSDIHPL